jgi:hypothetical protein
MSINLMSAIFRTEFRDLQDEEGNTTKASTAKFVSIALADHANDEGEGAYPSIGKLAYKTGLSRTAIINALDALKYNGILTAHGKSKWDTVNYTVNSDCFSQDSQPALLVNPVDSPSIPTLPPPVNPVDPNHPLTIHKPSIDIIDAMLDMSNFPGAKREARVNSILSYLGETFHKNVETKEWREFAKYIDGEHTAKGWDVKRFIEWLYGQKNFDLQYWPVKKMRENYPAAFVNDVAPERTTSTGYFA